MSDLFVFKFGPTISIERDLFSFEESNYSTSSSVAIDRSSVDK